MKSHFIREKYDYSRYGNKLSKLTVQGFYKRRDRMFFERMSRQYNDQEIQDFLLLILLLMKIHLLFICQI